MDVALPEDRHSHLLLELQVWTYYFVLRSADVARPPSKTVLGRFEDWLSSDEYVNEIFSRRSSPETGGLDEPDITSGLNAIKQEVRALRTRCEERLVFLPLDRLCDRLGRSRCVRSAGTTRRSLMSNAGISMTK